MTADQLNAHLTSRGIVQVTTYGKSTIYTHKHVGCFKQGVDENIYVKRGKSWDCLTMNQGQHWLVAIRLGHCS